MSKYESDRLIEAVDTFADEMKMVLLRKNLNGWHGWRHKRFITSGQGARRMEHQVRFMMEYGDHHDRAVHIANFAMFIADWHRKNPQ